MSTDASMSATISCDVLVVGGGAAGLSAAAAAADRGASVVVVERDHELGGILNQCIHNGFGLHRFGEELTGPEFAARDVARVEAAPQVEVLLDTTVLSIGEGRAGRHDACVVGAACGLAHVDCGAVVLACGCRERTRGQINIAGGRPAGGSGATSSASPDDLLPATGDSPAPVALDGGLLALSGATARRRRGRRPWRFRSDVVAFRSSSAARLGG